MKPDMTWHQLRHGNVRDWHRRPALGGKECFWRRRRGAYNPAFTFAGENGRAERCEQVARCETFDSYLPY